MNKEVFIVVFLGICGFSYGQDYTKQVIPPNPTAREFDKYINYDVSLANGIPEIRIPIHQIQVGNATIPIELTYHASGIKFGQSSGELGVGWVLQPGHRVSRTINGRPDEFYDRPDYIEQGFPSKKQQDEYLSKFIYLGGAPYPYTDDLLDGEFDFFSYSLPTGSGGQFILDDSQQGQTKQVSNSTVTIGFNRTSSGGIDYFDVVDGLGTAFRYGKGITTGQTQVENNSPYGAPNNTPSGWMLTDVLDFSGNFARFNYGNFVDFETRPLFSYLVHQGGFNSFMEDFWEPCYSNFTFEMGSQLPTIQQQAKRITSIETQEQTVIFYRQSTLGIGRMDSIVIKDKAGFRIKKIAFFHGPSAGQYFLDSVSVYGKNNLNPQTFRFDYYDKTSSSMKWADYWGYYTPNPTGGYPLPDFGQIYLLVETAPYNRNYQPVELTPQLGMENLNTPMDRPPSYFSLKKITYPSGGSTEYEYEANRYIGARDDTNTFGEKHVGIRIKRITSDDVTTGITSIREYRYGLDESGLGTVENDLANNYFFASESIYLRFLSQSNPGSSVAFSNVKYNSFITPELAFGAFIGSPVHYSKVVEYETSILGSTVPAQTNGKVEYTFGAGQELFINSYTTNTNIQVLAGTTTGSFGLYQPKYISTYAVWKKPMMTSKKIFAVSGSAFSPIKMEEYDYVDVHESQYEGIKVRPFLTTEGSAYVGNLYDYYAAGNGSIFNFAPYYITTGSRLLKSKKITTFTEDQSIVTKSDYTYNTKNQIVREKTSVTGSDTIVTYYSHPSDFLGIVGTDSVTLGIKKLQEKNVLDVMIENSVHLTKGPSGNEQMINASFTTYHVDRPLPKKIAVMDNITPLNNFVKAKLNSGILISDNRYAEKERYPSYDSFGNPLLVTETGGPSTSYLWSYGGQYPVAAVNNAVQTDIAHADFEADGKGNWTYSGVATADASAPTGKRVYGLSGGSMQKTGLTSGRTYLLTYWAKSASATGISGGTATAMRTKGGWTQYRRVISGVTGVTLTGSVAVDDVRLHPVEAAMDSYTYDPLVGMTSHTDPSGAVFHYEYDPFGRLKAVRDLNGHVVQDHNYHYRNQ